MKSKVILFSLLLFIVNHTCIANEKPGGFYINGGVVIPDFREGIKYFLPALGIGYTFRNHPNWAVQLSLSHREFYKDEEDREFSSAFLGLLTDVRYRLCNGLNRVKPYLLGSTGMIKVHSDHRYKSEGRFKDRKFTLDSTDLCMGVGLGLTYSLNTRVNLFLETRFLILLYTIDRLQGKRLQATFGMPVVTGVSIKL